jgi:hypothetical protein
MKLPRRTPDFQIGGHHDQRTRPIGANRSSRSNCGGEPGFAC